ncbi:site-specific recombinase [Streptomyces sp. KAU_LT]|uniref:site-specific recombinase n=1 Tax=Streptomyces sp. KAU_LT TaxID=3046669 RepID=UPI0024B7E85E|nr:site-specific recombinase [Streptomyces sp. KAU_LT]MDI9833234.1 site-specific recombinase [Streptomyces sp. KAU_LT]
MGIERRATEEGRGPLRASLAQSVTPLARRPTYEVAVEEYLAAAGIAKSSARIYRISLTTWGWMLRGEAAPTGPARRGRRPASFDLATLDDPGLPSVLAELAAARADDMDADTVNRELSVVRKAVGWWQGRGWIATDPTVGIERRPAPRDRMQALSGHQIAALWALDASPRDKTFWKLLHESAARAEDVLRLNIEEMSPGGTWGRIVREDGVTVWIRWQSGTAALLPGLTAGRTCGPLFLTDRKAPARTPIRDICRVTGRARLSYRRAEEVFEASTRLLANPLASPHDIDGLEGWTLRRLRRGASAPAADDGVPTLPGLRVPLSPTPDPGCTRR